MSQKPTLQTQTSTVLEELSPESIWLHLFILLCCMLYLLNLTFGFDLVPDNLPFVGNLDEVGATLLGWRSLQKIRAIRKAKAEKVSK